MALSVDGIAGLVERVMAPTIRRVNGMVKRGVIRRVTDSARQQLLQLSLLEDEVADEVEHLQPFGLSFVPPAGSEVAALAVGGNQDYLLALGATSRAHRPTGAEEGEGGLYTLDGWKVFLDEEGNVFIGGDAAGATVKVATDAQVEARLSEMAAAIVTAAFGSSDGGSTLQTNIKIKLTEAGWGPDGIQPPSVGSSKVWVVP